MPYFFFKKVFSSKDQGAIDADTGHKALMPGVKVDTKAAASGAGAKPKRARGVGDASHVLTVASEGRSIHFTWHGNVVICQYHCRPPSKANRDDRHVC